jgi:hypothetical protein
MTIFLATLLVITALVFGAPLAHAESLSDMPPVGTYIGFPGRHIPRLTVGTDGFSISSHIASCVTTKSTLSQDKVTHVVAFDARCIIDGKTWISHEKWRVFSENGETYLATVTTTGKGKPVIELWIKEEEDGDK